MTLSAPLYIMGDIHGQYEKLTGLLRDAGLVDDELSWMGGAARLWFIGDFFDRGPGAIETVDMVMRLQAEAADAGGQVEALLGNHEPLILAAKRFGETRTARSGTFLWSWRRNGGDDNDLARLTSKHIEWLSSLPAMALVDEYLLIHADSAFYTSYGATIDQVNRAMRTLQHTDDPPAWDHLLDQFSGRKEFLDDDPDGPLRAAQMLLDFGGQQIIHGHTPISSLRRCLPEEVLGPMIYANGVCVNVDGGMYLDGPGFLYRPADGWVLHGPPPPTEPLDALDDMMVRADDEPLA